MRNILTLLALLICLPAWGQTNTSMIPQLPAASIPLTGAEQVPLWQNGTKQVTTSQLENYGLSNILLGTSASSPNPNAGPSDSHTGLYTSGAGKVDITSVGTNVGEFSSLGLTTQLVAGGTSASSALTLESTTGAGTSDAIHFDTATQQNALTINTTGYVIQGALTPQTSGDAQYMTLQLISRQGAVGGGVGSFQYSNNGSGAANTFFKSRSTTPGTFVAVQNGDDGACQQWDYDDGTKFWQANFICTEVDGTVSTSVVPTRMTFETQNASGSNNQPVTISPNGYVSIGGGFNDASYPLQVKSTVAGNSTLIGVQNTSNSSSANGYIILYNDASNAAWLQLNSHENTGGGGIDAMTVQSGSGNLLLNAGSGKTVQVINNIFQVGSNGMISSGNVGIGTASVPASPLEVVGLAGSAPIGTTTGALYVCVDSAGNFYKKSSCP